MAAFKSPASLTASRTYSAGSPAVPPLTPQKHRLSKNHWLTIAPLGSASIGMEKFFSRRATIVQPPWGLLRLVATKIPRFLKNRWFTFSLPASDGTLGSIS